MRNVFITGAAAGIGLAVARRFSGQGYFVGLYDINRDALDATMQGAEFSNAVCGHCDVTSAASIEAALADFTSHTPPVCLSYTDGPDRKNNNVSGRCKGKGSEWRLRAQSTLAVVASYKAR